MPVNKPRSEKEKKHTPHQITTYPIPGLQIRAISIQRGSCSGKDALFALPGSGGQESDR